MVPEVHPALSGLPQDAVPEPAQGNGREGRTRQISQSTAEIISVHSNRLEPTAKDALCQRRHFASLRGDREPSAGHPAGT